MKTLYCFPFSSLFLLFLPPPHFQCFPSTTATTFLLFCLHNHHRQHISTVLSPPPPPPHFYCFLPPPSPPPLFYCFPSTTTTTSFPLFPLQRFYKRLQIAILSSVCSNVSSCQEQSCFSSALSCLSSLSATVSLKDSYSTTTSCTSPGLIQYT